MVEKFVSEVLNFAGDIQRCHHGVMDNALAVVALGNSLRKDDGIALAVLDRLVSTHRLQGACYFPLGIHTGLLGRCLPSHTRAVIIDAYTSGAVSGSVSIFDISPGSLEVVPARAGSSHGLSFMDEILASGDEQLPRQILFIGIEVADVGWGEEPSQALLTQLPEIASRTAAILAALSRGERECTN